jgi:hypothetical protein
MRLTATVAITRHPNGPRVYVGGLRLHHGTAGIVAIAAYPLTRNRALLLAGIAALAHDFRDFPFTDNHNH